MISYTTISTEDSGTIEEPHYELSALFEDNEYFMPRLDFKIGNKLTDSWDSSEYLVDVLYPFLCNELIDEEMETILGNDKKKLMRLMNEAMRLGFFKNIRRSW